jgi:hypothetical protein
MFKFSYLKLTFALLLLTACGEEKSDQKQADASLPDMEMLTDLDLPQADLPDMD